MSAKPPHYLEKILREAGKFKKGTIAEITVYHDSWCAIYAEKPCNCNPDISTPQRIEP